MSVKARKPTVESMVVTGFKPETRKRELKAAGKQYAAWLQQQIANLYNKESAVAGKLKPNTRAWTKFKQKNGFETKRGHMTGHTQDVLDNTVLYEVLIRGTKSKLRVVIVMKKKKFYNAVGGFVDGLSYIQHYEGNKVPNDLIMALKPGWARNVRRFFKGL